MDSRFNKLFHYAAEGINEGLLPDGHSTVPTPILERIWLCDWAIEHARNQRIADVEIEYIAIIRDCGQAAECH